MAQNQSVKFNLPFSFAIADKPPEGINDPQVAAALKEVYNALQQAQLAFHNYCGIGQQKSELWSQLHFSQTLHAFSATRYYAQAAEDISYGHCCNIVLSGGVLKLQKANATNNTKPPHGFCTTLGGILTGNYGEIICFRGLLTDVSGLIKGSRYFLSTTGGLVTTVAPVAAGNIEIPVGFAFDTNAFLFEFGLDFIQH